MTEAAEIESAQPWRVYYPEDDESPQAQAELANACSSLWGAALGLYFTDCASALRGKAVHGDKGEALEDITSQEMPLLRHLCHLSGADVQRVSKAMIAGLDAGNRFTQAAMHRPVVERHEDYTGARPKTKGKTRSPWRETGGGLGSLKVR